MYRKLPYVFDKIKSLFSHAQFPDAPVEADVAVQ